MILDREAKAYEHVQALLDSGGLPAEDVCCSSPALKEANATDDELADLAGELAAEAGMVLSLTGAQLRELHEPGVRRARARKRELPGLATSLQQLVAKATEGKWHLPSRRWLSAALLIAEEMHGLALEQWWRPPPAFLVDRIIPPLNRPVPAGAGYTVPVVAGSARISQQPRPRALACPTTLPCYGSVQRNSRESEVVDADSRNSGCPQLRVIAVRGRPGRGTITAWRHPMSQS